MNSINNTLFIGKVLHFYETLSSTNVLATEMLDKQALREGTVILTFDQSEGKGQLNNKWESESEKNIAVTIVLKPDFLSLQQNFLFNQAIALGVYDFIRLFIKEKVSIKWSNDIYVADKKIAGILIQNSIQGHQIQHSIVGIGININQAIFRSDAPNPTSIFLETGKEISLWSGVDFLCKYLENRYLQLKSNQLDLIKTDYHDVLYRIHEWHPFEANGICFQGKIRGIADSGQLLMDTADGEKSFGFKEVKFL